VSIGLMFPVFSFLRWEILQKACPEMVFGPADHAERACPSGAELLKRLLSPAEEWDVAVWN
jgi:hypothetical protein